MASLLAFAKRYRCEIGAIVAITLVGTRFPKTPFPRLAIAGAALVLFAALAYIAVRRNDETASPSRRFALVVFGVSALLVFGSAALSLFASCSI
jgi:uncharacterized membrane protein YhhN